MHSVLVGYDGKWKIIATGMTYQEAMQLAFEIRSIYNLEAMVKRCQPTT